MAALPLEALARIKDLEERLEDVKFHVRALQQVAAGQVAAVGAAERCRLRLSLAFGIASLFYVFLKTQGQVLSAPHPVLSELARVQLYTSRLSAGPLSHSSHSPHTPKTPKAPRTPGPQQRLDSEAAKRFVRHGVGQKGEKRGEKRRSEEGEGEEEGGVKKKARKE